MGKTIPISQLMSMTFSDVQGLNEEWRLALGDIEDSFGIFIYGDSGNGKSSFTSQLLRQLSHLGSILYISYEEAHSKSIQKMFQRSALAELGSGVTVSDGETFDELKSRLKKKKSPKIVVIDSWQYSGMTFDNYKELKKLFLFGKTPGRRKIFVIISHTNAGGKKPQGITACKIQFDSMIKVFVKGYIAFITSRYENLRNYVIWEDGAKGYWGKQFSKSIWRIKATKKTISRKKQPENTEA